MTLRKRIIACLDVTDGRVVKGTRFVDLVDAGDPVELAALLYATSHGAVDLALAGQDGESKGLDDPLALLRLLLVQLEIGG